MLINNERRVRSSIVDAMVCGFASGVQKQVHFIFFADIPDSYKALSLFVLVLQTEYGSQTMTVAGSAHHRRGANIVIE